MKQCLIWLFLITAVLLQAATAWDQDLKIRSCTAIEWNQATTPAPGGGQLFVWSDARADDRNIYAQLVDANGLPVWGAPRAIDTKAGIQRNPVVTTTSDGFFVIAWIDTNPDRLGNVYLQKINHQGQLLWTEGGVRASASPNCSEIKMITDTLGGVIVAWDRYDNENNYETSYAQSIAANGSRRWIESGITIDDENGYLLTSIISDGNNGFYTATASEYSSTSAVILKRYNPNGVMAWDNPIFIGNDIDMNRNGLLALGIDTVYLYWFQYTNETQGCLLQAYSSTGTALWTEPITVDNNIASYATPENVMYSQSDNTLLMVTRLNGNYNGLAVNKFNTSGQNLWTNLVLYDLDLYDNGNWGKACIESDGSGGAYVLWNKIYSSTIETDIFAQHLSSTGAELWQPGGVLVSNAPGYQYYPYLSVQGQDVWTAWFGQSSAEQGVWYQKLGNNGQTILEPDGRYLFGGLASMYTEGRFTLQRSNDVAILWDDDRMSPNESQIRLQTVNSSGDFGYTINGANITVYHPCTQYIVDARVLSNDRILVIWNERQDYNYSLYAQLISVNGFALWGNYGIQLSNNTDGYDTQTSVSEIGDDIYIGWTHIVYGSESSVGTIYMQKISDGEIQWTAGGKSMLADADLCSNHLNGIYDDYLVYDRRVLSQTGANDIFVMRFNTTDGTPQTAWGNVGVPVDPSNSISLYTRGFINAKITPQGLYLIYRNISTTFVFSLMVQYLSPTGQLMFGQSGTAIIEDVTFIDNTIVQFGESDFAIVWKVIENQTTNVKVQRFRYSLVPLWEPVIVTTDEYAGYYMCLTRDAIDGLALVWPSNVGSAEQAIVCRFVSPSGELIGADALHQINCSGPSVSRVQTAYLDGCTLVTWSQGSSMFRDEPMEHQNLMAQLIINQTTAIDDPIGVPAMLISAVTNYPNPFNPTTTISYTLNQPSNVEIGIYNLKGQLVRTLLKDSKSAGLQHEIWNGLDAQGKGVSSGIYFYRITAAKETRSGKMILIK